MERKTNDHLVHLHNEDDDHLFYNNTEQRGLSQPTTDKHPEVPENTTLASHHSQRNHHTSSKLKNHVCATVTTVSTEGQKVCHNQKASQEEYNNGDKVLHHSFTHPCQTASQCLPENFLPYWTDSQQIIEDPFPKAKMQQANLHLSSSKLSQEARGQAFKKRGEPNRLRQI